MRQPTSSTDIGIKAPTPALLGPRVLPFAVFAWLAATAWVRPLALPDEGRYVGVALEMLWSGNWLLPTLDSLPYFHKPPLFYWLTGASLWIFGLNELAARLTSLLTATGCAVGLYQFLRRWCDDIRARLALLALVTTPLFYGGAQFANLDMLVSACIAGTVLCSAHAVLASEDGPPPRVALAAAYALAAFGLLAKGLIGVVLPGLIIVVWSFLISRPAALLRLIWLPGVLLFCLLAVPWFALMQARFPDFFHVHVRASPVRTLHGPGLQQRETFLVSIRGVCGHHFAMVHFPGSRRAWASKGARRSSPSPRADVGVAHRYVGLFLDPEVEAHRLRDGCSTSPGCVGSRGTAARSGHSSAGCEPPLSEWRPSPCSSERGCSTFELHRDHNQNYTRQVAAKLGPLLTSPADPVIAVGTYPFSLSFYLHRPLQIRVVEEWKSSWITQKDTWRLELLEAARFAPTRGKLLLLDQEAATLFLACSGRTAWLIVPTAVAHHLPSVDGLERMADIGDLVISAQVAGIHGKSASRLRALIGGAAGMDRYIPLPPLLRSAKVAL